MIKSVLVTIAREQRDDSQRTGKEPAFWKAAIKPYMEVVLKDPFSAHYRGLEAQYHVDHPDLGLRLGQREKWLWRLHGLDVVPSV